MKVIVDINLYPDKDILETEISAEGLKSATTPELLFYSLLHQRVSDIHTRLDSEEGPTPQELEEVPAFMVKVAKEFLADGGDMEIAKDLLPECLWSLIEDNDNLKSP